MTTINNITIKFRSKFEKLIKNDAYEMATEIFKKFLKQNFTDALELLWQMTYDWSSLSMSEVNIFNDTISDELITSFRNELRHQYSKIHPDFLEPDVPATCEEAFKTLKQHSDIIIANVVYAHCLLHLDYYEDTDRILFLLNHAEEKNYYGGIRSLHFSCEEASYLKPYHSLIHDLFKAMSEYHTNKSDVPMNTPFANLNQKLEEVGFDVAPVS